MYDVKFRLPEIAPFQLFDVSEPRPLLGSKVMRFVCHKDLIVNSIVPVAIIVEKEQETNAQRPRV